MWVEVTAFLKKITTMKELSKEKIEVIKKIYGICPNILLTGSIALTHYGIIDRFIEDIDFVVSRSDADAALRQVEKATSCSWSEIESEEDEISVSYRGELDGQHICLFVADGQEFVKTEINGVVVNISHPRYAIEAKRKYVEFADTILKTNIGNTSFLRKTAQYRQKHLSDIEAYEKWMGSFILKKQLQIL